MTFISYNTSLHVCSIYAHAEGPNIGLEDKYFIYTKYYFYCIDINACVGTLYFVA